MYLVLTLKINNTFLWMYAYPCNIIMVKLLIQSILLVG